jgi:hypothetical protein
MDISDLPTWFLDVQRAKQGMVYGRIPLELVVSNQEISKVVGSKSDQVRFQPHEQHQKAAKLWVLDILNNLDTNGTTTFSVIHKGPIIKQINTFQSVEYNYAPGSKQ